MKNRTLLLMVMTIGFILMTVKCQSGTPESSSVATAEEKPTDPGLFNEDMGEKPWVLDIEAATLANDNYRVAHWSGKQLQLVFMSLKPGEIIDLERHEDHDQFLRIEKGEARVFMGETADHLSFDKKVSDNWAILVPAGFWHKIENTGSTELKIYTLYGPPEHAKGKINKTYQDAKEGHDSEHDDSL